MVGGEGEEKARDDKVKKKREKSKSKEKEIKRQYVFIVQIKMISLVVTKTVWMKTCTLKGGMVYLAVFESHANSNPCLERKTPRSHLMVGICSGLLMMKLDYLGRVYHLLKNWRRRKCVQVLCPYLGLSC